MREKSNVKTVEHIDPSKLSERHKIGLALGEALSESVSEIGDQAVKVVANCGVFPKAISVFRSPDDTNRTVITCLFSGVLTKEEVRRFESLVEELTALSNARSSSSKIISRVAGDEDLLKEDPS